MILKNFIDTTIKLWFRRNYNNSIEEDSIKWIAMI